MDDKNWSEQNKNNMHKLMDSFLRSDKAMKEINPTMWLSVIDFADRQGMFDLSDHARDIFYDTFTWDHLDVDIF